MITTTRKTRRATKSTVHSETPGRGVPPRALADGILERRRTPRRRNEPSIARPETPSVPLRGERLPELLSPTEHYRLEIERRTVRGVGGPGVGDLATLLAEAKAEYEAMLAAPRPVGKGGRPKKKPAPKPDEIELSDDDALGGE